jgi:hypothetical protein
VRTLFPAYCVLGQELAHSVTIVLERTCINGPV